MSDRQFHESCNYIPLTDWLLVFWHTAVEIARLQQEKVIRIGNRYGWKQDMMRQWLDKLMSRDGRTTQKENILLQHRNIILSQLEACGKCESTLLESLAAKLQNSREKKLATDSNKVDSVIRQSDCGSLPAQLLRPEIRDTYRLIAADPDADAYLNVAFATLLQRFLQVGKDQAVSASYDLCGIFLIERVQLVKGTVVGATRCVTTCEHSAVNKIHSEKCVKRDAVWILLTLVSNDNRKIRRQVHLDLCAIAYGNDSCIGQGLLPLHCGFLPFVEGRLYDHFESSGWPIARLPLSQKAPSFLQRILHFGPSDSVNGLPCDEPLYVIHRSMSVIGVMEHYNAGYARVSTYPIVNRQLKLAQKLFFEIERSKQLGQEQRSIGLSEKFKSHGFTREQAMGADFELKMIRKYCRQSHCVQYFLTKWQDAGKLFVYRRQR